MTPDSIRDCVRFFLSLPAAVLSFITVWSTEHSIRPPTCFLPVLYVQLGLTWGNVMLLWAQPLASWFSLYRATFVSIEALLQLDSIPEDPRVAWRFYNKGWSLGAGHALLETAVQLRLGMNSDLWSVLRITLAASRLALYFYLRFGIEDVKGTGLDSSQASTHDEAVLRMFTGHFKVFKQFIWPNDDRVMRRRFFKLVIIRLLRNALALWLPSCVGRLMRNAANESSLDRLACVIPWVFLRLLLSPGIGLSFLYQWNWLKILFNRQQKLDEKIFTAVMDAGFSYHRKQSRSAITAVIEKAQDVDQTFDTLLENVLDGCFAVFVALPVIAMRYGCFFLIIAAFCSSVSVIIFRRSTTAMFRAEAQFINLVQLQRQQREDAIQGWVTAAVFGQTGFLIRENNKRLENFRKTSWIYYVLFHISEALSHSTLELGYLTGAVIVFNLIQRGQLGWEDFVAHEEYWIQLFKPLSCILEGSKDMVKKLQDATEAFSLMETASKPKVRKPIFQFGKGQVDFCNVEVTFGSRVVLEDFTLSVAPGTKIAIVGPSGVGKSTLLALLSGQTKPTKGKVLIDGQSVTEVDHESLSRHVGIVEQKYHIFNSTVIENVRYGKREASKEEVQDACKKACIHDVIMERKEAYDSSCGDMGSESSMGELQRIAIARLFLKGPSILLIDEGTSALDAQNEGSIKRELTGAFKGSTVIIAAHRLSSIIQSDIILVLGERGKIVERGNHATLLALNRVYAGYWQELLG